MQERNDPERSFCQPRMAGAYGLVLHGARSHSIASARGDVDLYALACCGCFVLYMFA